MGQNYPLFLTVYIRDQKCRIGLDKYIKRYVANQVFHCSVQNLQAHTIGKEKIPSLE